MLVRRAPFGMCCARDTYLKKLAACTQKEWQIEDDNTVIAPAGPQKLG
jgi:hypothetical protein